MKNKKILYIIAIALVLVVCCILISTFVKKDENILTINSSDFTISNITAAEEDYDKEIYIEGYEGSYEKAYYIKGSFKSTRRFKNVYIEFDILDKSNNVIGTAMGYYNDVEIGKDVEFKLLATVKEEDLKNIKTYKLNKIRGE